MISAIILADNDSPPMDTPRALLRIGEKTFLHHIVDVLKSARVLDAVVVFGEGAEELQRNLHWFSGKVVLNGQQKRGQLSSVLAGLQALEQNDLHGILICPIDRPLLSQHVIVGILNQFWIQHKPLVVPVYEGQWGYPVLVGKSFFPVLETAPPESDVMALISSSCDHVLEYPTEDDGVVVSIKSERQYQEMIAKRISTN